LPPISHARLRLWLPLLVALGCSGAAGLTYQVLWLRLLSLVFGVTAYAASTVLAGFMSGLALGSVLAGRLGPRLARPLRAFAILEPAIAATALASGPVLEGLPGAFASLSPLLGGQFAALTAARLGGTLLVLLVPTAIMGATLPLVAMSPIVRAQRPTARIAAAYAANTAGAIAGAVLTGYVLVGGVGIRRTFWLAAAANVTAALLAAALSAVAERGGRPAAVPDVDDHAGSRTAASSLRRRAVLVALAGAGAAGLALEVIWFRILVLFVPATTYAFTTMLAAVLGGLAAGGWAAAALMRRERDWTRLFAATQTWTAVLVLASLAALCWTYAAGWRTSGLIQASILAIVPAALLMGMALPLAIRLVGEDAERRGEPPERLGRDVGTLYGVNVCGAIAGSLAAGFWVVPAIGSRAGLLACAAIYVVCGVLVAATAASPRAAIVRLIPAIALGGLVAALVPDPYLVATERRHGRGDTVLWREEGLQTTVSVHRQPQGRTVLYLDGLHQANDSPEMLTTHRQIGHLPMVLHRDVRRALVIGLGGGATAGAVSQHRGAAVDVIELSAGVRTAAAYFAHANYDVLAQPNVSLRVDDGRNFLLTTDRRYDVITADIVQPIHAGAGLLYSVEYYRLARRVLTDDGVMLQWVGHRSDAEYRLLVRSFQSVFPETTVWVGGTLLVGSTRPLTISRTAFERQQADPVTRRALDAAGLDSFETLLSWYVAGPAALRAFVGPGLVLSDDRPLLEYHRSLPAGGRVGDLAPLLASGGAPPVGN
jgi:spermidine synthase